MRRLGGWCEMAASLGISCDSPTSKDMNMEAEKATTLEAVTRWQPVRDTSTTD
jgi:hypothetical protein